MTEKNEWEELVERHLRDELNNAEKERLAELIDSDPSLRSDFVQRVQWDVDLAESLRVAGSRPTEFVTHMDDESERVYSHSAKP